LNQTNTICRLKSLEASVQVDSDIGQPSFEIVFGRCLQGLGFKVWGVGCRTDLGHGKMPARSSQIGNCNAIDVGLAYQCTL
jgi:hypothetical protein